MWCVFIGVSRGHCTAALSKMSKSRKQKPSTLGRQILDRDDEQPYMGMKGRIGQDPTSINFILL